MLLPLSVLYGTFTATVTTNMPAWVLALYYFLQLALFHCFGIPCTDNDFDNYHKLQPILALVGALAGMLFVYGADLAPILSDPVYLQQKPTTGRLNDDITWRSLLAAFLSNILLLGITKHTKQACFVTCPAFVAVVVDEMTR